MKVFTHNRNFLILVLLLTLAAMVLLGSGVSGLQFEEGRELNLLDWFLAQLEYSGPTVDPGLTQQPGSPIFSLETGEGILRLVILSFWLFLIFSIVYAIISPDYRKELFRGLLLILLVVWLLPLIANNLNQRADARQGAEMDAGSYILGEPTLPNPPAFIQDPPGWIFLLVNISLFLLLAAGIYGIWRRLRRKPGTQAVIVNEIRRALVDLERGGDLENVVITCYAEMCAHLDKRPRVQRRAAMTPREFETHLAKAGISNVHIHQLTDLFEQVRYGAKRPDSVSESDARTFLNAILRTYED